MAAHPDPLFAPKLKIERAKKHILDLIAAFNAMGDRNPYRIVRDQHTKPSYMLYRLQVVECIPTAWSTIIGDAIHNLRAALDLLICALIIYNKSQVKRRNGFPIAGTQKRFEADAAGKVDGASETTKRFVRRLKPYKTGNSALWQIHELDTLDKHKSIVPVLLAYRHFSLQATMNVPWQDEPIIMPAVNIMPRSDGRYPLKDGDILLSTPADDKTNYEFAFEIAFSQTQIVDGEPVIPTLQQYGQLIERIIAIAERRLIR